MKHIHIIALVFVFTVCHVKTDKRTAEDWKSRIIYQLLTDRFSKPPSEPFDTACSYLRGWCGGTFQGIIHRLDYIQELGANAIWISPIVLNTPGGYHGYWAKDINQVESHFGTEQDLHDLVQACHERDIWVMVDVVPNHMGYPYGCDWPGSPNNTCDDAGLQNYTGLVPFDSTEHYHKLCFIEDFDNQTQVEECRLANLPDLNQTVPVVAETLYRWIQNLTEKFNFDGYRVDTTKHIAMNFWSGYQEAASTFLIGEVTSQDAAYTAEYQNHMDSLLNFPSTFTTNDIFHFGQPMTMLKDSLQSQRQEFNDVSVLGLFADNHDMPRFLNRSADVVLLKNILVYVLLGEGIPIIYQGTEQAFNGGGDPENRESLWPHYETESDMFKYIRNLTNYRLSHQNIMGSSQTELYADNATLVFSRGNYQVLGVMSKLGTGEGAEISMDGLYELEGKEYTNIWDVSDVITVEDCRMNITINNGEPKVYEKTGNGTGIDPGECSNYNAGFKFGIHLKYLVDCVVVNPR